MLLSDT